MIGILDVQDAEGVQYLAEAICLVHRARNVAAPRLDTQFLIVLTALSDLVETLSVPELNAGRD